MFSMPGRGSWVAAQDFSCKDEGGEFVVGPSWEARPPCLLPWPGCWSSACRRFPLPREILFPRFPVLPFYIAFQPDFPGSAPQVLKGINGVGFFLSNPEQFRIQENTVHSAVEAETVFKDTLWRRKAEGDGRILEPAEEIKVPVFFSSPSPRSSEAFRLYCNL